MSSKIFFPINGRYLHHLRPTPLIPIKLEENEPSIWCKLEYLRPSGSTKDRIARYIIEKEWRQGNIGPDSTIIEASSGSTSIALAMVCAQFSIKFIAVVPQGVSSERVLMIKAYGAKVEFAKPEKGMKGAIEKAVELAKATPNSFLPKQFENMDNAEAHRLWTGNEILNQIPRGIVHGVVSGVGTGGTIVGLYKAFKEFGCPITPFAAYPIHGLFSDEECCSFSKRIPGVVEDLSKIYKDANLPNLQIIEVDDSRALEVTRKLIKKGFPVGPSSGLNYLASLKAQKILGNKAKVATVFPDRMERYFSTELFLPFRE